MKRSYILAAIIYVTIVSLAWYIYGQTAGVATAAASLIVPLLTLILGGIEGDDRDADGNDEGDSDTVVTTFEDRKRRAKERLDPHFTLRESAAGDVELYLDTEQIRGADRAAMLWVFGKWALADTNPRHSKTLTVEELRSGTDLKGGAVGVFLSKMEHFLIRDYPEDPEERHEVIDGELVRMDEAEMEFELNENYLEEIVDYILGERNAPN